MELANISRRKQISRQAHTTGWVHAVTGWQQRYTSAPEHIINLVAGVRHLVFGRNIRRRYIFLKDRGLDLEGESIPTTVF